MNKKFSKLFSGAKRSAQGKYDRINDIDGDKVLLLKVIIGAAVYLLTMFSFMRNGFGTFLRIVAFFLCSYDLILAAIGSIFESKIFTTNLLISIAGVLAICVGKTSDALLFILTYRVFSMLEELIIKRNERSIKRVLNLRTKDVKVYSDGKLVVTPTDKVKVGDYYMVAPGDRIPLDGIIVSGISELDTEPLTGETTLKKVHNGSPVLSGSINVSGTLSIRVTANLENSLVTKRLKYSENYREYVEKINDSLGYFNSIFTPTACAVALFVGIVAPLFMGDFAEWLHRASILLALACPLPIFASCAMTYFAGVGTAASKGILFKNKEGIDALEQAGCVVFDKNGTLSNGRFVVTSIEAENVTGKELLELASLAFSKSNSPIARAIMVNVDSSPDEDKISNFYEEEGKFCVAKLDDGRVVAAGNGTMIKRMGLQITETHNGDTVVYVCLGRDYMGCIRMSDKYRSDAHTTIAKLRELEVSNINMVSGESNESRNIIAKNIGLDSAYYAVTDKEKVSVLNKLTEELDGKGSLVYVGSGNDERKVHESVNASVAMNGLFSENAIKFSNVILVKSEPTKLCTAISVAKSIKRIIKINITLMTAVTTLMALFAIFGIVTLSSAILVECIATLVVIVNSMMVK